MCSECHHSPCLAGCPNYVPKQIHICEECGEPIFEGDTFVDFIGSPYHLDCIKANAYQLLCDVCELKEEVAK